jgi:hypothetical protein
VFDAEVVDGLAHAYLARDALGLDADVVERIRAQIHAVATSPDARRPAVRLNQFNWYCAMLAADALVNGTTGALARGMAAELERFLTRARENFGAGLRFHYLPHRPTATRHNVDSAEYANIVLSFARHYGAARAAGMRAPARLALLRAWVRRALAGYWTHGGYLNWDSGLGFDRWHQAKKWPLAAQALLGLASAPELPPDRRWGTWAKWLLDRGIERYVAQADREGAIPAALAFGVHQVPQSRGTAYLAAARHAANAVRALEAGLGHAPAARPPALYAYDPDIGRLAVTTPAYNTAIVAVNQGAFPYGGLDLARLYDGEQEVAANIGGVGTAAFGLVVPNRVRTQYGRREFAPGVAPLRVFADGRQLPSRGRHAFAGAFRDLRVTGTVRRRGVTATAGYRFTPGAIEARWSVPAGRRLAARVRFPSWGREATVLATLTDGRVVSLGRRPVRVRALRIRSERSGYRVTLAAGARARLIDVRPQSSAPDPGPTVEVALPGTTLGARITVGR